MRANHCVGVRVSVGCEEVENDIDHKESLNQKIKVSVSWVAIRRLKGDVEDGGDAWVGIEEDHHEVKDSLPSRVLSHQHSVVTRPLLLVHKAICEGIQCLGVSDDVDPLPKFVTLLTSWSDRLFFRKEPRWFPFLLCTATLCLNLRLPPSFPRTSLLPLWVPQ